MNTETVLQTPDQTEANEAQAKDKKMSVEINKLSKRLHRQVGQAITDYNMIEEGDKVMVCLSGGKVIGTPANM